MQKRRTKEIIEEMATNNCNDEAKEGTGPMAAGNQHVLITGGNQGIGKGREKGAKWIFIFDKENAMNIWLRIPHGAVAGGEGRLRHHNWVPEQREGGEGGEADQRQKCTDPG